MEIPKALLSEIRSGRCVLFLGAGASKGARNSKGEQPPNGSQLKGMLSDRFLGGGYRERSLEFVAELAISETDLITVQDFVRETFEDFNPGDFHMLLPTIRWRAIVTTNYDRIIEEAYESEEDCMQSLVPFISNKERVDEKLRNETSLPLIKLHGCITRTRDESLPLILTVDQYVTHKDSRSRLFNMFEDLGYEYPIVFIGYGMEDHDIRAILQDLTRSNEGRPRYYIVSPDMTGPEERVWGSKRVTVIKGTFQDFIETVDRLIPRDRRRLQLIGSTTHPIESKFAGNFSLSENLLNALTYDLDYVYAGMPVERGTPYKFYQGFDLGWYAIEQGLDVRRELAELFVSDIIVLDEQDRSTMVELHVIKAEAGAGKSVFLRRLAWEASNDWEQLCLYAKEFGQIDYNMVYELYHLSKQRIFLFVDNAIDNMSVLEEIILQAKKDQLKLTIFTCERINEWNMGGEGLIDYVTQEYKLPYLSNKEIRNLIQLLTEHDCLGYLASEPLDEQIREFEERAGRQLLVALHEATLGKPYEEILVDEFNEIRPREAQNIYLTVCILNRLGIHVRAGIISRVYGVPFSDFKNRFFAPLEHVVNVVGKPRLNDFAYEARHPHIAQIVFERILIDPGEKFDFYIRLLKALNISYSSDRKAFRKLILGNSVLNLFPNFDDAIRLYDAAFVVAPDDGFVYQQRAIFEMKRANGSLDKANEWLQKAKQLEPQNNSIFHSLAELFLLRSEAADEQILVERYRNESRKIALGLCDDEGSRKVAYHTLIKGYLDELRDLLEEEDPSERSVDNVVRKVEEYLESCLQEYPGDSYLHSAESRLYELIDNQAKAFSALDKAFQANPRNPFVAIRLSKIYEQQGDFEQACDTIKVALRASPGNQRLRFRYAMLLLKDARSSIEERLYHLKRSFTEGDRQYESQFWYAVHCFLSGRTDVEETKRIFRHLRGCPVSFKTRMEIRYFLSEEGQTKFFRGTVGRKEGSFGFIDRDGFGDAIFVHMNNNKDIWNSLQVGSRVRFCVGFNFGGPTALEVKHEQNTVL